MKKTKKLYRMAVQKEAPLALVMLSLTGLLCFSLVLAACPGSGEAGTAAPRLIKGTDLTDIVSFPCVQERRPNVINEGSQWSGTIEWLDSEEGFIFEEAYGVKFFANYYYRAVISLTAGAGFTFKGAEQNSFIHRKAIAMNPKGTGKTLTVIIDFPKLPSASAILITGTDLSLLIETPAKNGIPQTNIDHTQYCASICWKEGADEINTETFKPSTSYTAVVDLSAKPGFTFSGLAADSFSHSGAQSVVYSIMDNSVTIRFRSTAGADEKEIVSRLNLTNMIAVPVYRETPVTAFENTQYTGYIEWFTVDGAAEIPITGKFPCGKNIKAIVTLSENDDFTFNGLGENTFTHRDAFLINNYANSGLVIIIFPAADWNPGVISYPRLGGTQGWNATAQACCWPVDGSNDRSASILINMANPAVNFTASTYWDYGWQNTNSDTNNNSSWAEFFKTPLLPGGFNGDECGQGHPGVLLKTTVPEEYRKRAHVFTFNLNSVREGIISFGMFPRTSGDNIREKWPIQFELLYSNDPIGPIPDEKAVSLGIFEWDRFANNQSEWRDVNLGLRTPGGKPVSAQYIQLRVYAESRNGKDATWLAASFGQIRIGLAEEDL